MKCFEQTVGVKKDRKSCDTVLLILYCCKFKVPVSTDIFPKTKWRILQIIVCGFISMFVHHNLARNSIIIINFQKTSFRLLFFGFDILLNSWVRKQDEWGYCSLVSRPNYTDAVPWWFESLSFLERLISQSLSRLLIIFLYIN